MSSLVAFTSGAAAGLAVDLTLFPVDTIKTRLQSAKGFRASGGFHNLYAGIGPVIMGSAPGAAVFFATYESSRAALHGAVAPVYVDMMSASLGEVMACVVRVPVEVIKQRTQTSSGGGSSVHHLRACLKQEGAMGLFRGYKSTVVREIPFSLVQFPLWEWLKREMARRRGGGMASGADGAVCGFVSGGIAAAITTPLDVAKTRIMLARRGRDDAASGKVVRVMMEVLRREGVGALFAGVLPRTLMISFGGFIFLGVYEQVKQLLAK